MNILSLLVSALGQGTIYAPMAAMCDGSLYVEGNDQTAPDLIFLRSQKME